MKILDKYVAKNFLLGYVIAFGVLIGLRVIIDLFVNLDEFAELSDQGLSNFAIVKAIIGYYGLNLTLYFRDFAGMINIVAAVFSLGKMVRNNELVAIMSSGVSLKRVIMPIIILSILLTGLLIVDQEFLIPPLSSKLVRSHDSAAGGETYDVWFITDSKGSLINSRKFETATASLHDVTIIVRATEAGTPIRSVKGLITAKKAIYNKSQKRWDLEDGRFTQKISGLGDRKIDYYETDLTASDIPVRCKSRNKPMLSMRQLNELTKQKTMIKDVAQLYSQKHFRFTDPIINMIMLMISLPILVCRDPKSMKFAILISFLTTTSCYIMTFVCKMLATEAIFGDRIIPELWAWLPIIIFLPIAMLELDSMKT